MHAAPPTGARAPHPCTRCPGSRLRWRLRFPVSAATADVALGPRGPWRGQTGPSPSCEPARTSSRSGLAERTETRGPRQAWGGPAGARQAARGLAASAPARGFTRESQLETRTLPRVARPGGRGRCWWAWVGVGSGAGGEGVATGPAVCGALNVQSRGAAETPVFGSAQSHWQLRAQAAWRPRAPRSPPLLATGPCHSALTPWTQPAGAARALGPCVTQAGAWRGPCVVGKPAGEAGGALTSQRMTGPAGVTRCQQAALVLRRGRRLPPPPVWGRKSPWCGARVRRRRPSPPGADSDCRWRGAAGGEWATQPRLGCRARVHSRGGGGGGGGQRSRLAWRRVSAG